MKIYITSEISIQPVTNEEHTGYTYFSSRKAAEQHKRDYRKTHRMAIYTVNAEISKRGILAALNRFGGHPDNG